MAFSKYKNTDSELSDQTTQHVLAAIFTLCGNQFPLLYAALPTDLWSIEGPVSCVQLPTFTKLLQTLLQLLLTHARARARARARTHTHTHTHKKYSK